jgi:hypothetical protein
MTNAVIWSFGWLPASTDFVWMFDHECCSVGCTRTPRLMVDHTGHVFSHVTKPAMMLLLCTGIYSGAKIVTWLLQFAVTV